MTIFKNSFSNNEQCATSIMSVKTAILENMKYTPIGHELAELAKQKGFNCSTPTQTLLRKWIKEKHQIHVVCIVFDDKIGYYPVLNPFGVQYNNIPRSEKGKHVYLKDFCRESFEEALETGLTEALKLIPDFVHLGSKSDLFS